MKIQERLRRPAALLLFTWATAAAATAQDSPVSAKPPTRSLISWQESAGAGALLVAGFAADPSLRDFVQDHRSGTTNRLADLGDLFGNKFVVVPALGLGLLGGKLLHRDGVFRASLKAGEAAALASAVNGLLKVGFGRGRPLDRPGDPDFFRPFTLSDNSFPSGHTALAFSMATALAAQTHHRWTHLALFSLAGLTGLARLNDDKHWASDVIAGAAIGILAGRWVSRRKSREERGARSEGEGGSPSSLLTPCSSRR